MQSILDAINEWIKEILIGAINGNLSTMFGDVNEKVGTIAAEVGQTPQGWNANIFSMIQTLSENVIVPIAGLVITYVLCYELISMVTEKNNMHDVDTSMFFKWVFKAYVAVYLVTHTFDITMAVFDMAQHVVSGAAGVIGGSTEIDVAAALASMQSGLDAMEIPELLLLVMETSLVSLCMKIMSVLITVILYGRMIEIYLYCSVSPIPFATFTNREWGQIGNNYLKSLFALGFQGFLIMICVGIYAVLVNNMIIADNLHSAIFSLAAYTFNYLSENNLLNYDDFRQHVSDIEASVKVADQRIAQINSELSTQKVIQKHCDSYRLCRKVIEDCKSAKNPKAYRTKHQAEYQLHDSLKKELQDLGVTKIPSSNKIQKRIENLESEQDATVREKQELQKKQKTLEIIQQNFTALLDAPEISSDLLPAKKEPVSVTREK